MAICIDCSENKEGKTLEFIHAKRSGLYQYLDQGQGAKEFHLCNDCKDKYVKAKRNKTLRSIPILLAVLGALWLLNGMFYGSENAEVSVICNGFYVLIMIGYILYVASEIWDLVKIPDDERWYKERIKELNKLPEDVSLVEPEYYEREKKRLYDLSYAESDLTCSNCKNKVPADTQVGQSCPHCDVYFGSETIVKTITD